MSGVGLSIPATALMRRARTGLVPEAAALLGRMSVPPSGTRAALIVKLVRDLISAGLWTKLDAFYMLAAHDAQAARLNWAADRYNATAVNSPTFTVDRGYAGTASGAYLDTGFNPASATIPKYAQNSASISAFSLTDLQQSGGLMGNGFGAGAAHILPFAADTAHYSSLNSAVANTFGHVTSLGHFAISRTASLSYKAFRDGVSFATYALASAAPSSETFIIGGRGYIGQFTTRRIAAATIGAGLADAEVVTLHSLIRSYLTAVGATS